MEYLDPSLSSYSVYFNKVATALVAAGYTRGKDLHGAPYDFRKAASEIHTKLSRNLAHSIVLHARKT